MIDFDALVIGPAMAIFAEPVMVYPYASNPDAWPYPARGIWSERPVDIALESGLIASGQVKTLSIKIADFETMIVQGDQIERRGVRYAVDDNDDDGQGGSVITLKEIRP